MSANIEDLLNDEDSDDDDVQDIGDLDLEQLLDGNDDDDAFSPATAAMMNQLKNKPLSGAGGAGSSSAPGKSKPITSVAKAVFPSILNPSQIGASSTSAANKGNLSPGFNPEVTELLASPEVDRLLLQTEDSNENLEALLQQSTISVPGAPEDSIKPLDIAVLTEGSSVDISSIGLVFDASPNGSTVALSPARSAASLSGLGFGSDLDSVTGSSSIGLAGLGVSPLLSPTLAGHSSLPTVSSTPIAIKDCSTLKLAEMREQRSLHQGEKINMSALHIRRTAATSSSSAPPSPAPPSSSNGMSVNAAASAMTVVDEMSVISGQLKRNGTYQQHGPGTASAICACSKFTAIGTSKGFVLMFDQQQEIRRVLTSPPASKPELSMAVTSLDCLHDGSMLVSGHKSGDVVFWDCAKGLVLRQVRDPNGGGNNNANADSASAHGASPLSVFPGEISQVCFLTNVGCLDYRTNYSLTDSDSFHVVTLTAGSVINRYKLSKSLLTTWHVEADCLLDESLGRVLSLDLLRPLSEKLVMNPVAKYLPSLRASSSSLSSANKNEFNDLRNYSSLAQFFAFGFVKHTTIVQVSPELKVLYKWEHSGTVPLGERVAVSTSQGDGEGESKTTETVPASTTRECLDWTYLYLTTQEPVAKKAKAPSAMTAMEQDETNRADPSTTVVGVWTPVLTRCRGNKIEMLAMRVLATPKDEPTPATVTPAAAPTPNPAPAQRRSSLMAFASAISAVTTSLASATVAAVADEAPPPLRLEYQPMGGRTLPGETESGSDIEIVGVKWLHANQLVVMTRRDCYVMDSSLTLLEKAVLPMSLFNAYALSLPLSDSVTTPAPPVIPGVQEIEPRLLWHNKEVLVLIALGLYRLIVRSPFEQADAFIQSGKWLEGLALIVESIQKSPALLISEQENIQRYIMNYATIAVKRGGTLTGGNNRVTNSQQANKNHFHLVASVCVEYCVATDNLRLLFYDILNAFRTEGHQTTLLEALEPFILARAITSLPPSVIADFLSVVVSSGEKKHRTVERCVAYFDPLTLDLNFVTKFLYEQRMFSTFLYVYSYGLGDCPGAMQQVFQYLMTYCCKAFLPMIAAASASASAHVDSLVAESDDAIGSSGAGDSVDQVDIGYKLLLFAQYTFEDKVFPRGDVQKQSVEVVCSILQFLTTEVFAVLPSLSTSVTTSSTSSLSKETEKEKLEREKVERERMQSAFATAVKAISSVSYPFLTFFSRLDASALMFVLFKGVEKLLLSLAEDESLNGTGGAERLKPPSFNSPGGVVVRVLHDVFSFSLQYDDVSGSSASQNRERDFGRISMENLFFQQFHTMMCSSSLSPSALSPSLPPFSLPLPLDLLECLLRYAARQPMQEHKFFENELKGLAERQSRFHGSNPGALAELRRLFHESHFYLAALSLRGVKCTLSPYTDNTAEERLSSSLPQTEIEGDGESKTESPAIVERETSFSQALRYYLDVSRHLSSTRDGRYDGWDLVFDYITAQFAYFDRVEVSTVVGEGESEKERVRVSSFGGSTELLGNGGTGNPSVSVREHFRHEVIRFIVDLALLDLRKTVQGIVMPYCLTPSMSTLSPTGERVPINGGLVSGSLLREIVLHRCVRDPKVQFHLLKNVLEEWKTSSSANAFSLPLSQRIGNGTTGGGTGGISGSTSDIQSIVSADILDIQVLTVYVRLLAKYDPESLLSFMLEFKDCCPLDDCLSIAKEHAISDAISYMLEKAGDVPGALSTLLKDLSLKMKQARREVDSQLRSEAKDASLSSSSASKGGLGLLSQLVPRASVSITSSAISGALSPGARASANMASKTNAIQLTDAVLKLPGCRSVKHLIDCLCDLCERQGQRERERQRETNGGVISGGVELSHSEQRDIWFQAFDHLLNERRKSILLSISMC